MDAYTRMALAAYDEEIDIIESVAERAGVIWKCRDSHWVNLEDDETCGECGKPKSEVARFPAPY